MRFRIKPWLLFILLALATAAILYGIYKYRHRFVQSEADMLGSLPSENATVFFANVATLRHTGMLNMLAGSKPATEPEYREFVRQTHFDYTRDLDEVAGAAPDSGIFLVVRGRFDWGRLRDYASTHGGGCTGGLCKLPTSRPGRWASYIEVQPDVMGLALSRDSTAAEALEPRRRRYPEQTPSEPVWLKVSPSLLSNPANLPEGMRLFAIALQPANSVILSLAGAGGNSAAAFDLKLDAACPIEATAETVRSQLQIQTKMLRLELMREHEQPNPADLTGLLTSGTFYAANKHVIGTWPVPKALLNALQ